MNSIIKKSIVGGTWTISASVIWIFFKLFSTPILARIFSPEEFGITALLILTLSVSRIFFSATSQNLILFDLRKNSKESVLTNAIAVNLFHSLLLVFIFNFLSAKIGLFLNLSEDVYLLEVFSFTLIFIAISSVFTSFMNKRLNYKNLAVLTTKSNIFGVVVTLLLASYTKNYISILIGYASTELLVLVFSSFKIKFKLSKLEYSIIYAFYKDFWNITLTKLLNKFALNGDYLVIQKFIGPIQLGIYSKSYQLIALSTNIIGDTLGKIGFSSLVKADLDNERTNEMIYFVIKILSLIIIPFSIILRINSELIIDLLLGDQWLDVIPLFKIISVSIFFRLAYKIIASVLKSRACFKQLLFIQSVYAINIIFGSFMVYDKGINCIAYIALLSIFIQFLMMLLFLRKQTNISVIKVFGNILPGVIIALIFMMILLMLIEILDGSILISSILSTSITLIIVYIIEKQKNILGLKKILNHVKKKN